MKTDKKNWYQYPYVWLVICLPLSAVIGGIITIRLAVVSDDGLVTDDYYKEGLEINRMLERDKASEEFELAAAINLDHQVNKIKLMLSAENGFEFPHEIKVTFLNKTRKGFDQELLMKHSKKGIYSTVLPDLIKGNWYVQIEADNWRLINSLSTQ